MSMTAERARELARQTYGSDEVEIDDDAVISKGDNGVFVQAWLWIDEEEDEDDES